MKLLKGMSVLAVILLFIGVALNVNAQELAVSYSKTGSGPADTVYVAGNPNAYPIEYYDSKSESYKGLMPLLLEKIAAETGYQFCYVYTSHVDARHLLAENKQVEVISGNCCDDKLPDGVEKGSQILHYQRNGEDCAAFFAYTTLADNQLRDSFEQVISSLSEKEMSTLMISSVSQMPPKRVSPYVIILSFVLVLFLTVGLVISLIKYWRIKKDYYENRFVDRLTGIGNRAFFSYRFAHFIPEKMKEMYFCYYFGFDDGIVKNSIDGNEYVKLMKAAAEILSRSALEKSIVAVVADSGFAVLQPALNKDDAENYAGVVLTALNQYEYMFSSGIKTLFRAGIYRLHRKDKKADDVVYNAFQGYRKAEKEKSPISFTDEKLLLLDAEKEQYKSEIALGMQKEEFKQYLQLIVDSKTNCFVAAEVLSRWENPIQGLLKPGKYIDLIHQIGLTQEFDLYTVRQTFKLLDELQASGLGYLQLSCNVTRTSISDKSFSDSIRNLLDGHTFKRQNLTIEITEESLIENPSVAKQNVDSLKSMGFKLAIDDMGTGYTSFSSMCDFPVDVVKIDREIVVASATDKGHRLLNGIVALSKSLGFKTVCEGVENKETDRMVKEAGCDFIQGFYYSNVYPVKEAKRILLNR